jgi:hypothetical protein
MGGALYWSTPHAFFTAPQYGFPLQQVSPATGAGTGAPAWSSYFDPSMGGAPYWSMSYAFFTAPQYGSPVKQVGALFTLPPPQQSPPSTLWFREWGPQSHPQTSFACPPFFHRCW